MNLFGNDKIDYGTASETWTPEQWQSFGARGGEIGSDLNLEDPNSLTGLGSLSGSQLGGYAQVGGLALGAYDDLFGTGGKSKKQSLQNAKKSGVLLDQQIANNTQNMADKKAFNQGMADASAKAMGLGTVYNYK